MRLLPLSLILLASAIAEAAAPLQAYSKYGAPINGATLDAASTSFAITASENADRNGAWGLMTVWVTVTDASNSVSALTMTCTGSHDRGATDYTLQDCTTADGTCTSNAATWTKNPSGITSPKKWPWRVDVEGMPHVECTFTDTGGDGSDTLGVYVTFSTKG